MKRRRVLLFLVGFICAWVAFIFLRPILPARPITRTFPAAGIKKVVLRAKQAQGAKVRVDAGDQIQVTGLPTGGAEGYHSPDPFWRETPAKDWGLDFVAKQYGDVLVISSKKEISYIHHYYALANLSIQVPEDVVVVKEKRKLSGDGAPDLKKP